MIEEIVKTALSALVSFALTAYTLKWWVNHGRRLGLVAKDMNKPGEVYAVEAGGIWFVIGSVFGLLLYLAADTYTDRAVDLSTFAITEVLLLSGFLGFIDDILGWKKGLSPITRVLFTFPIALPLVVIKAGYSTVELPLIGVVELGVLYPLLVVPAGVVGASNAFNMLAGYNGLEASMGLVIVLSSALFLAKKGFVSYIPHLLIVAASLLAFLMYNKYPARVFPGNCLTYAFGAFYASVVAGGNFEKFGLAVFSLYFVELALFIRGLLNGVYKENFGKVGQDGTLTPPYDKSYSLTHLAIRVLIRLKGSAREQEVVLLIVAWQLIVSLIALALM